MAQAVAAGEAEQEEGPGQEEGQGQPPLLTATAPTQSAANTQATSMQVSTQGGGGAGAGSKRARRESSEPVRGCEHTSMRGCMPTNHERSTPIFERSAGATWGGATTKQVRLLYNLIVLSFTMSIPTRPTTTGAQERAGHAHAQVRRLPTAGGDEV